MPKKPTKPMNRKFYISEIDNGGPEVFTVIIKDLNDDTFSEEVYLSIEDVLEKLKDQHIDYKDLKI